MSRRRRDRGGMRSIDAEYVRNLYLSSISQTRWRSGSLQDRYKGSWAAADESLPRCCYWLSGSSAMTIMLDIGSYPSDLCSGCKAEIGRASCRERVESGVGAGGGRKKMTEC